MRSQRFQNRVTAGRFTLPAAILISVACWILSAILLPDLEIRKGNYPLWDIFYSSCIPTWGTRLFSFILYSVIGYFLIGLNNAFAIIRMRASVDSHLFPADFRLPYHAHTVCRRFGSGHFSHCSVFPVQELSAIQVCKLSVSRVRIYRNGESAFSATDILCSRILDRRV